MNLTDDSPGFTDHPRTDIETHRSLARWLRVIAVVLFLTGFGAGLLPAYTPTVSMAAGTAFAAVAYGSANALELQALRWEWQLERNGEDIDV